MMSLTTDGSSLSLVAGDAGAAECVGVGRRMNVILLNYTVQ